MPVREKVSPISCARFIIILRLQQQQSTWGKFARLCIVCSLARSTYSFHPSCHGKLASDVAVKRVCARKKGGKEEAPFDWLGASFLSFHKVCKEGREGEE